MQQMVSSDYANSTANSTIMQTSKTDTHTIEFEYELDDDNACSCNHERQDMSPFFESMGGHEFLMALLKGIFIGIAAGSNTAREEDNEVAYMKISYSSEETETVQYQQYDTTTNTREEQYVEDSGTTENANSNATGKHEHEESHQYA